MMGQTVPPSSSEVETLLHQRGLIPQLHIPIFVETLYPFALRGESYDGFSVSSCYQDFYIKATKVDEQTICMFGIFDDVSDLTGDAAINAPHLICRRRCRHRRTGS
ncbi:hypothetical protein QJS10_CPB20g00528 [Acorus calamus]|uniref:Uncharacterized protein n=1 Tax=Acorus calamus TaxID=4465 RepID=A0AAV9CDC3_ACOCL|nr:hypothetical protein QJS10_CPB20g00528 [Acorus calamus]